MFKHAGKKVAGLSLRQRDLQCMLTRRFAANCGNECPGSVPGRSKHCYKKPPPVSCLLPMSTGCPVPIHLCPRPTRPPQPDCCRNIITFPKPSCGYCPGPCPRSKDLLYWCFNDHINIQLPWTKLLLFLRHLIKNKILI